MAWSNKLELYPRVTTLVDEAFGNSSLLIPLNTGSLGTQWVNNQRYGVNE
jgi:hypothetical protein